MDYLFEREEINLSNNERTCVFIDYEHLLRSVYNVIKDQTSFVGEKNNFIKTVINLMINYYNYFNKKTGNVVIFLFYNSFHNNEDSFNFLYNNKFYKNLSIDSYLNIYINKQNETLRNILKFIPTIHLMDINQPWTRPTGVIKECVNVYNGKHVFIFSNNDYYYSILSDNRYNVINVNKKNVDVYTNRNIYFCLSGGITDFLDHNHNRKLLIHAQSMIGLKKYDIEGIPAFTYNKFLNILNEHLGEIRDYTASNFYDVFIKTNKRLNNFKDIYEKNYSLLNEDLLSEYDKTLIFNIINDPKYHDPNFLVKINDKYFNNELMLELVV